MSGGTCEATAYQEFVSRALRFALRWAIITIAANEIEFEPSTSASAECVRDGRSAGSCGPKNAGLRSFDRKLPQRLRKLLAMHNLHSEKQHPQQPNGFSGQSWRD